MKKHNNIINPTLSRRVVNQNLNRSLQETRKAPKLIQYNYNIKFSICYFIHYIKLI